MTDAQWLYNAALKVEGLTEISPFISSKFLHGCNKLLLDNPDNTKEMMVSSAQYILRLLIKFPDSII